MDVQGQPMPRVESRGEMHFVGLQLLCETGKTESIGALWDSFFAVWEEIQGRRDVWGLSLPSNDGTGSFTYMPCCEVDPAAYGEDWQLPEGMHHYVAPAARYAIYPFAGTPSEMGTAIQGIFRERLPAAGLSAAAGNPVFEYYPPDCYDEGANSFKCELLAPIEN